MIAAFLKQELDSPRFGPGIRAILAREGLPPALVSAPDLSDASGNAQRKRVLMLHRGYGAADDQYLAGFPSTDVRWEWWALTPADVLSVKYIRWDYWLELTEGSRRPADAARRILAGIRIYGVSNDGALASAAALRAGARFPEIIVVTAGPGAPLVVLEGHARLTAYALAPECLPDALTVLLGTSPAIAAWDCY